MIYLELFFAVIILLVHLKKKNWQLTLFLVLIFSCFIFTIVRFPLAIHLSEESEIYWAYIGRSKGQLLKSLQNTEMPLFYVFYYTLINIFKIDPATSIILLRFLICIMIGFSYLHFSKNILKKQSMNKSLVIFIPTFFCLYDWNINYLALGDELRNALALPFLILLLDSISESKYYFAIFYALLAFFSHKLGIVFSLLTFPLFFLVKRFQFKINKYHICIFLPILTLVLIKLFRKIIFLGGNRYIISQINHNILLGILDGLLRRPGVILAEIIYLSLFYISIRNFEKIKLNATLLTSLTLSIIVFTASNYGIIMHERFQEPNRFYFMLGIYLPIVAGSSLIEFSKKIIAMYVVGFFLANFLFKQFARDVINIYAAHAGSPLADLINYIILNKSYIGCIFLILILILFSALFKRKIFSKETYPPI